MKAAQTLRTRRSHLIAVGIPPPVEGRGEVLDAFLHALTEQARQRGYRVLLITAGDDRTEIDAYGALLSEYDLDAFVVTSTHTGDARTAWLGQHRVPFVTPRPPTAFVCVSDVIALGAWTELTSQGLIPGRDAAVTGFGDSAAAAVIGLTSLAQPVADVAGACLGALQKLLAADGGRRRSYDRVLLEPRLVLRSSG